MSCAPTSGVDVSLPLCSNEHACVMSDYAEEGYETGWVCNLCKLSKQGTRWFCLMCRDDYCFDCVPGTEPLPPVEQQQQDPLPVTPQPEPEPEPEPASEKGSILPERESEPEPEQLPTRLVCDACDAREEAKRREEERRREEEAEKKAKVEGALKRHNVVLNGDVQVVLMWEKVADFDLYVTCPHKTTIYYGKRKSPCCGGSLDVDMQSGGVAKFGLGVENITWAAGTAPHGEYAVKVRGSAAVDVLVHRANDGQDAVDKWYQKDLSREDNVVCIFSYPASADESKTGEGGADAAGGLAAAPGRGHAVPRHAGAGPLRCVHYDPLERLRAGLRAQSDALSASVLSALSPAAREEVRAASRAVLGAQAKDAIRRRPAARGSSAADHRWGAPAHPTTAKVRGFESTVMRLWDDKGGDVLDEFICNLKAHPSAYAPDHFASLGGGDDARRRAFLEFALSAEGEKLERAIGAGYARYRSFPCGGREVDVLRVALVTILLYSMSPADVDVLTHHPAATGLADAKAKIAYRQARKAEGYEASNAEAAPFEVANEAIRVACGEQKRGRFFDGEGPATQGLQKWVKFLCLLDALAEAVPPGADGAEFRLDGLRRLDALPEWADKLRRRPEKFGPRAADARAAAETGEAHRGVACAFAGGAELVASWRRLAAGSAAAMSALTSAGLSARVAEDFLSTAGGGDLVNIRFTFHKPRRQVTIYLASQYPEEIEILMPMLTVWTLARAPEVREVTKEVKGATVTVRVLDIALEAGESLLPAEFRERVLVDAERANARLVRAMEAADRERAEATAALAGACSEHGVSAGVVLRAEEMRAAASAAPPAAAGCAQCSTLRSEAAAMEVERAQLQKENRRVAAELEERSARALQLEAENEELNQRAAEAETGRQELQREVERLRHQLTDGEEERECGELARRFDATEKQLAALRARVVALQRRASPAPRRARSASPQRGAPAAQPVQPLWAPTRPPAASTHRERAGDEAARIDALQARLHYAAGTLAVAEQETSPPPKYRHPRSPAPAYIIPIGGR